MKTLVAASWMSLLVVGWLTGSARAEEPLHARIDQRIAASAGDVALAPPAGDHEFVRRVYLDLAGRIPTLEEVERFVGDRDAGKRTALIDRLLDGPDYPRRMQEWFHAMLMERRGDDEDWTRFLRSMFERNVPWDEMAHSILKPDAEQETTRGAAFFATARLVSEGAMAAVDVPGLTRDVGRMLAGVDLQCAQCHNDLTIEQYKQRDFQGLHMIFENVQTRRDVQFPAIAEKLMTGKKEFMSVFEQEPMETGPRVPGGEEIAIPTFPEGEQYAVPPDRKKRTPGVPKFSPLNELAAGLASADNRLFCRNIANRLWFFMMGRGLVEPLDVQHQDNPPTHPELLELLADELAAHDFDIQWMLRELALTDCYQRTSVLPEAGDPPAPETYALALEKRVSAEQLFWSVLQASGEFAHQRGLLSSGLAGDASEGDATIASLEALVAESESLSKLQAEFIKSFANPPQEPEVAFEPTVKAALFLMHDPQVLRLLQPKPGNLVERLAEIKDDGALTDRLFLTILARRPSDEDRADFTEYLQSHADRRAEAIGYLAWALLSSTEFCVNH